MKSYKLLLSTLLCASSYLSMTAENIKAVCIDVEALFETNEMRAGGYIGKFNALKYKVKTGHLPCKADVFKNLAAIPGTCKEKTCNENIDMPHILCDWLLHAQPFNNLKNKITDHLKKSKLSDIEKLVLINTINMMLTPKELADTQQTISFTQQLISTLRKNKYLVYLVGNWSDTPALKHEFQSLFNQCHGIFFSDTVHHLKPHQEFYNAVLEQTKLNPTEIVWIEKEKQFISKAQHLGMKVVSFNPKHPKETTTKLRLMGLKV